MLDVQLPDMTGFDVCAELERRYGAPPDIILVSSRDVSDYGQRLLVVRMRLRRQGRVSGDLVSALLP